MRGLVPVVMIACSGCIVAVIGDSSEATRNCELGDKDRCEPVTPSSRGIALSGSSGGIFVPASSSGGRASSVARASSLFGPPTSGTMGGSTSSGLTGCPADEPGDRHTLEDTTDGIFSIAVAGGAVHHVVSLESAEIRARLVCDGVALAPIVAHARVLQAVSFDGTQTYLYTARESGGAEGMIGLAMRDVDVVLTQNLAQPVAIALGSEHAYVAVRGTCSDTAACGNRILDVAAPTVRDLRVITDQPLDLVVAGNRVVWSTLQSTLELCDLDGSNPQSVALGADRTALVADGEIVWSGDTTGQIVGFSVGDAASPGIIHNGGGAVAAITMGGGWIYFVQGPDLNRIRPDGSGYESVALVYQGGSRHALAADAYAVYYEDRFNNLVRMVHP